MSEGSIKRAKLCLCQARIDSPDPFRCRTLGCGEDICATCVVFGSGLCAYCQQAADFCPDCQGSLTQDHVSCPECSADFCDATLLARHARCVVCNPGGCGNQGLFIMCDACTKRQATLGCRAPWCTLLAVGKCCGKRLCGSHSTLHRQSGDCLDYAAWCCEVCTMRVFCPVAQYQPWCSQVDCYNSSVCRLCFPVPEGARLPCIRHSSGARRCDLCFYPWIAPGGPNGPHHTIRAKWRRDPARQVTLCVCPSCYGRSLVFLLFWMGKRRTDSRWDANVRAHLLRAMETALYQDYME